MHDYTTPFHPPPCARTLLQAGYVGDDVESILHKLLQASNFQVQATQGLRIAVMKGGATNLRNDLEVPYSETAAHRAVPKPSC